MGPNWSQNPSAPSAAPYAALLHLSPAPPTLSVPVSCPPRCRGDALGITLWYGTEIEVKPFDPFCWILVSTHQNGPNTPLDPSFDLWLPLWPDFRLTWARVPRGRGRVGEGKLIENGMLLAHIGCWPPVGGPFGARDFCVFGPKWAKMAENRICTVLDAFSFRPMAVADPMDYLRGLRPQWRARFCQFGAKKRPILTLFR